jgi:hypothetical protein
MLLANFLCALYTNVISLIDESALPSDVSLSDLLRQPLQSFDTGANGPLVFFHRHAALNVLCAVFLKRSLLINPDAAESTARFRECGDWLARQTLHTFVNQFHAELSAKPFRASTKVFKPFGAVFESLYTSSFSNLLLQSSLEHIAQRWQPKWMYVMYAEEFARGMDQPAGAAASAATSAKEASKPPKFTRPASTKVADASSHGDIGIVPPAASSPAFIPHPPSTPAPAHAMASRSSSSFAVGSAPSFFSARAVASRTLHPFRPRVRKWWHFGLGGNKEEENRAMYYQQLGRTMCFYQFKSRDGLEVKLKDELIETEEKTSAEESKNVHDAASLPSPDALRKLVALVHQAGTLLSQPREVADQLNWMEVQLKPSASNSKLSDPNSANPTMKLWVMRIHELILCFPTAATTAASEGSPSTPCSFTSLLASLQPHLSCLRVHYDCVQAIQERQYRALQKGVEKQQAAAKAAAAAAK